VLHVVVKLATALATDWVPYKAAEPWSVVIKETTEAGRRDEHSNGLPRVNPRRYWEQGAHRVRKIAFTTQGNEMKGRAVQ
jgi:hypothetical protein